MRQAREVGAFSGPHFMRISSNGIFERVEGFGEETRKWRPTHDILRTKRLILLFTSSSQAYLIPRSDFTSPEHETTFCERARQHIAAARGR